MAGEPENQSGQSQGQQTQSRKRQDNQDARLKRFFKEYGVRFGAVFVASYVPEMLKVLPAPGGRSNLTTFSSAISVLVFGIACMFRHKITAALTSENRIKRWLPAGAIIAVMVAAWCLTGLYNNTHWSATAPWSEAIQTLLYLIIIPLYVLALTIILFSLDGVRSSFQHIQDNVSRCPLSSQKKIQEMIGDFSDFFNIAKKHPALGDVGFQQIDDFGRVLADLARGRTAVPGDRIPETASELLLRYPRSFHAVSNQDVELWIPREGDPNPNEYFKINVEAVGRGTKATRIFVFSWRELCCQSKEIVKVLRQHEEGEIGWGVALFEALPLPLRQGEAQLMDFALLNWDEGFIVFRDYRQAWRRLNIVLAVDKESRQLVQDKIKIFETLVAHCWLANKKFVAHLQGIIQKKGQDIQLRKNLLQKIWEKHPQPAEDQTFMLEVTHTAEIEQRTQQFSDLAQAYRRSPLGASNWNETFDLEPEGSKEWPHKKAG